MTHSVPTRRDEAWRYSDLVALADVWPLPAAERIVLAPGDKATRTIVETGDGIVVRELGITLAAGARLDLHILNSGARFGRIAVDVTLGRGAEFNLGGVQIGGDSQTLEIVTTVTHAEPEAVSRQTVRSVLGGHATGTYLGKVAVARAAQKTDSAQSVRAMLLDRTATANAKPELEIFADDVKCAHGCAVGELDARGLFYLASRGLPPPQAKALMLHAFVAEAFTDAEDREALEAAAFAALEALL